MKTFNLFKYDFLNINADCRLSSSWLSTEIRSLILTMIYKKIKTLPRVFVNIKKNGSPDLLSALSLVSTIMFNIYVQYVCL